MSYSLCQLLTNIDGNLLGHSEIDYNDLPEHLISLGEFEVPYKQLVIFTHQALLRDYGRGEEIGELDVRSYWREAKDGLTSAGSVQEYVRSMQT
jgi:hypothetical protein